MVPPDPLSSSDGPSPDVIRYVRGVVAMVTGQEASALPDALDQLGLDSLSRMNVTVQFEQDLGPVHPTLLFEHRTITEVAEALVNLHPTTLAHRLGPSSVPPEPAPPDRRQHSVSDTAAGFCAATGSSTEYSDEDIAVIGVDGRYPGSPDMDAFWETLRSGADRVTEIPSDRWDWRRYHDPRRGQAQKSYGRWGGFLDDVAGFDAHFFNILPSDAEEMDPQERILLETVWNLLEETGYLGPSRHERSTGVFMGSMYDTYGRMGATGWARGRLVGPDAQPWLLANRISYQFDFQGPSYAVNSACSSSLTAVHLACESLRRGEARMAIAGGANLILHPSHVVGLAAMNMLAADGRCKVFDARADGFVPGEGVGVVLLKTLRSAVADQDRIWGVIRASAVNTAGRTSGFTVPNPAAQADVLAEAVRRAGVSPDTISYIEAHGTGTELGDPIEMAGINAAFNDAVSGAAGSTSPARCAVGSVKANIGHLEGASGIAGLTKVLLQLQHGQIAPCVNLDEINPKIDTGSGRFFFPLELTDWTPRPGVPRRAGVSAFGAGGSNVHLIVEEYPGGRTAPSQEDAESHGVEVFLLSAKTEPQLRALAELTAELLESGPAPSLRSLAHTSQTRRKEMPTRLAVPARSVEDLAVALRAFVSGSTSPEIHHGVVGPDGADGLALAGEEGAAFLEALCVNRRLTPLARLWVQGAGIDWSRLWPGPTPVPVRLPPYPFTRKRYWVPAEDQLAPATPAPTEPRRPRGTDPEATSAASHPAPASPLPPDASSLHHAIKRELRLIASAYLLVDESEVDTEAELMDLGFDSISLVSLIGQVCDTYGVDLDAFIVFDHPSLGALARHLEAEHHAATATHHRGSTS
ncbi:beta-ketoacyl synthase N-terminal-like domain-containing protein [Streptomyces sp. NPDC060184]|uniref:beta-ketoacyl synthase N-terminal-like domain-containing protein n=1 Tax=Streptomyces sp. NPDC060184 TaxID=3347064 RepID=UPI00366467B0